MDFEQLKSERFPCPCCGYLVFYRKPGNHETCPICCWEDELAQLRFPTMTGISNHVSLQDAQINFQNYGASERRNRLQAREPHSHEVREAGWRPLDQKRDYLEVPQRGEDYSVSYPFADTTVLYYWRSTFWHKLSS